MWGHTSRCKNGFQLVKQIAVTAQVTDAVGITTENPNWSGAATGVVLQWTPHRGAFLHACEVNTSPAVPECNAAQGSPSSFSSRLNS